MGGEGKGGEGKGREGREGRRGEGDVAPPFLNSWIRPCSKCVIVTVQFIRLIYSACRYNTVLTAAANVTWVLGNLDILL